MGAVVPREVSVSDLFLAVRAVLCLIFGGIEFGIGLLADRSGVLGEIAGTDIKFTSWATAHLKPPHRFAFSGRRVTCVFLVASTGFLSLDRLYHLFSKLN